MKKLLLCFFALFCLVFSSCGIKMGNIQIINDSSDLVLKEIVFQDTIHTSYAPRVYSVSLNPGESWKKSIPVSSYLIVCEVERDSDIYIGCHKEIAADISYEIKVSELKPGYHKIKR